MIKNKFLVLVNFSKSTGVIKHKHKHETEIFTYHLIGFFNKIDYIQSVGFG